MSDTACGPLGGYLIVDLSSGIAGAYCTRLLADGGAAVVKVEPPEGDALRRWTASGELPAGRPGRPAVQLPRGRQAERRLRTGRRTGGRGPRRAARSRARGGVVARPGRRGGRRHGRRWGAAVAAVRPPAPGGGRDNAVRPGRTVAGPARHRVHPPGLVRRDRRPGPGSARPGAGARRRPGGGVAVRRVHGHRHPGRAGGRARDRRGAAHRPVDARSRGPVPDLLSGDLLRDAAPALAVRALAVPARRRRGQGRSGGPRVRHRTAVVRPVRHGGPPGVDRPRRAGPHRRAHPPVRTAAARMDRRPHGRGHQGPGHGLPHPQRAGQQRRDRHRA